MISKSSPDWRLKSFVSSLVRMRVRLAIVREHAEVEVVRVVEHAHFGVFGRRLSFARIVLDEAASRPAPGPVRLVQRAVDRDRTGGPHGRQPALEASRS